MDQVKIDFPSYTQASLEEVLVSVDRTNYPENHAAIVSEIEKRKANGTWNETDRKFRQLVQKVQGTFAATLVILFFGWILFLLAYRWLAGHEIPEPWGLVGLAVIAVTFISVYFRLARSKCPNCNRAVGINIPTDDDLGYFMQYKKCPHCEYSAK